MQARFERRQRARRRLLTVLAGAVPLAVALIVAMVFWPEADPAKPRVTEPETKPMKAIAEVETGQPLTVTTVDGSTYEFAGVKPGMNGRHPYADYVVKNVGADEALFVMPVDLFVSIGQIPKGTKFRPTDGVEGAYTIPSKPKLLGPIGGDWKLRKDGADWLMTPGSSFLVRVSATVPMKAGTQLSDVTLWLFELRYYRDRAGRAVPFPK